MKKLKGFTYAICSYAVLLWFFLFVLFDGQIDHMRDNEIILSFIFPVVFAVAVYFTYILYAARKEMKVLQKQIEQIAEVPLTVKNLKHIEDNARDKVFTLIANANLSEELLVDTHSNFGISAFTQKHLITSLEVHSSKTHNLELLGHFLKNRSEKHNDIIQKICQSHKLLEQDKINAEVYKTDLELWMDILKNPVKITSGRLIKESSILYYKIDGNAQYVSDVKGGGANLAGAVYGGIIAGGAGAVVGSQIGTDIKTDIVKKDDRKLFLYYNIDGIVKQEEIITDNIDYVLSLLREWMPDKEYSYVVANNNAKPSMSEAKTLPHYDAPKIEAQAAPVKRSYAELKELKELLDLGIITQAEFDQKKQEILG